MRSIAMRLGITALIATVAVSPAVSQIVVDRDRMSGQSFIDGGPEADLIQDWNQRHRSYDTRDQRRENMGPSDVIRLLQRRGFHVKNVEDVGPRFLVNASRDNEDVLVSVSRSGEIVGVVHERDR